MGCAKPLCLTNTPHLKKPTYLSRKLIEFFPFRKHALEDVGVVLPSPLQDALEREGLVVRYGKVLHVLLFDVAFLAVGHIAQMPNRDRFTSCAVRLHVVVQEVPNFLLVGKARCKLGDWDSDLLVGL